MIGIISLAAKATAVIVCAFAVTALARRGRASTRHGIYAALFTTLLLLPLVPRLTPAPVVPVPVALPAAMSGTTAEVSSLPGAVPAAESGSRVGAAWSWMIVVRTGYLAGLAALLLSLTVGVWRLRRLANDAEIWLEATRLATEIAYESDVRRAVLVVISDDVAVPMTFGLRRQTIVMPGGAKQWSLDALSRAIRHELEHVRRDDWSMQLLARAACALYWPHPMVWMALRRFCIEAERACDDAVVRSSDAPAYAEQLVTLARTTGRRTALPALAMASPSRLSERVRAILDPAQSRGPETRITLLLIGSAMVAVVLTFGSVQLVAAAAELTEFAAGDAVTDGARGGVAGAFDDLDEIDLVRDALIEAAEKGDIEALEFFLVQRGIDVNTPLIGDGTPLLIASRAGRKEAVRWLLERGADPNVPSPGDGNALIAAAGAGQTDVMQLLLDRGARIEDVVPGDENALITAAAAGSDQAVKLLIARGANVNSRVWADDREWRTPLIMARRHGHRDIMRILINAGARQ